jgi:membrane-associated phospholipid phosphatase
VRRSSLRIIVCATALLLLATACNDPNPHALQPARQAPRVAQATPKPLTPARSDGTLPPPPMKPPAILLHTEVAVPPLEISENEPTAANWKTILFAFDPTTVPPPPSGAAAAKDEADTAAIRAQDPSAWTRTSHWWSAGAVQRWNEIALTMIQGGQLNSGHSSRLLALLAVAQYDAAVSARRAASQFRLETMDRQRLTKLAEGHVDRYGYPSEDAAIAGASLEVLTYLFPNEKRFLTENVLAHTQSRIWIGAHRSSDIDAGMKLGQAAGLAAVAWGKSDLADMANLPPRIAQAKDKWFSPLQTLRKWGLVKPWVMTSGHQFRAPPPPPVDSPEFKAAVAEIRRFRENESAEGLLIARYWDLGVAAISVPGMWDQLGLEHAAAARFSQPRKARLLALMNMAMMDAGIASWDTKYHYLVMRPSMADPEIREAITLPSHPSYTSGHSAFSGAAEGILASFFPSEADEFHRLSEEASASRWHCGVHYRFDGDAGLAQGRAVAALVLSKHAADGAPPAQP